MKKRIWELDVFRGVCIIGMVLVHLTFDLVYLYGIVDLDNPILAFTFEFLSRWGGVLFLLLSGICVTLGSHPIRRGLIVLGSGLLVTAVTVGMYLLQLQGAGIIIYFGVLHCLGICMLLWPLFKKLPFWALGMIGAVMIASGLYLQSAVRVDFPWLIPFGVLSHNFSSSDYFPLLPNLGYFLVGAMIGKTLYRKKESLFPKVNGNSILLKPFILCGKYSLFIYLLHQPLITGAIFLWFILA